MIPDMGARNKKESPNAFAGVVSFLSFSGLEDPISVRRDGYRRWTYTAVLASIVGFFAITYGLNQLLLVLGSDQEASALGGAAIGFVLVKARSLGKLGLILFLAMLAYVVLELSLGSLVMEKIESLTGYTIETEEVYADEFESDY